MRNARSRRCGKCVEAIYRRSDSGQQARFRREVFDFRRLVPAIGRHDDGHAFFSSRRKSHEEDDVRRNRSDRRGCSRCVGFGLRAGQQHRGIVVLAAANGAQEEAEEAPQANDGQTGSGRRRPVAVSEWFIVKRKPASTLPMRVFLYAIKRSDRSDVTRNATRNVTRPRECPSSLSARAAACRETDTRAARVQ